ncbi:MAG: hypothetical protein ACTSRS_21220 [Candidatus Helarchaeota archaeon]
MENLGISVEEAFDGYYLRVDSNTELEEKVDSSSIISRGLGRGTQILQE